MFSKSDNFSYEIDPNFDFVIDEKANKFMALRKIKWGSSDEYKLDLRNYVAGEDGERMLKGCTFISEEGGHELAKVLIREGYGHPYDIANEVCQRQELLGAVASEINKMDSALVKKAIEKYENTLDEYLDLDEVI